MMGFIEFKGFGRRSLTPTITITRNGVFNLNRAFMETFSDRGKFVVLLWNKDKESIGLRFSKEKKPGSYKVRAISGERFGVIAPLSFLKFIGYKQNKSRRFKATLDEENGLVVIGLKKKA